MIMVRASCKPTEYSYLEQSQEPEVGSLFCLATEANGWQIVRYDVNTQEAENEVDVEDSLEALKEPPGVSLDDLRQELGA
jgi:hypothetical protein